jgi:hypothetical protein
MPLLPTIPYFWLILKYNQLLAPLLPQGFSDHLRPFNQRIAYQYLVLISNQKHLIQLDLAALFYRQPLYLDNLSWGYLILLPSGFNQRVNLLPPN